MSEHDTMLPEVVFWFDTTSGAAISCEVAKPTSAYRCLADTLAEHLMTHYRSHRRFPDAIQVVDAFCAEEIRKIVPLSIALEVRPVDELSRCVQSFLLTLQGLEKAGEVTAAVSVFSLDRTQKLVRNVPMFERLVASLVNDEGLGKYWFDLEENATEAPQLRELLWEDPCPFPQLEFICDPVSGEIQEARADNPWMEPFIQEALLPDASDMGVLQARVVIAALWDFKMHQWRSWFDGWGVREMEVFLEHFGRMVFFQSEEEARVAVETIACFFDWIVKTEDVTSHEKRVLLDLFHTGRPALEGEILANLSKDGRPSGFRLPELEPVGTRCSEAAMGEPLSETHRRSGPKMGRNGPCPCGSARKYKKCCWAQAHSMAI
ncbi:MAG: SEC-C metal-binding domain-containing protein [Myxococcota bacterium]|nr:SEC-C metal-binding domain-containing protein [Myxococcota bacterium]